MNPYTLGREGVIKVKTNNKGFTLIEVIVSMILVGIVVSVIFMPINFSFLNHGSLHEKAYIMSDTRYAMDYLTRQIRQSSQVEVTGNKIRTDSGVYGQEEGQNEREIKNILGIHEFRIKKAREFGRSYSVNHLRKVLQKAYEVDRNIKSGLLEASLALEMFIAEI
jgi:prepilin-type N-terminal cleavage/methylation domain-containing protein